MNNIAIRVNGLGKQYRLGKRQEPYKTLRETITDVLSVPFRMKRGQAGSERNRLNSDTIWALKDVSFTVRPGEVVGVIGRNGAGKSTLLKILSRITEPTVGYAVINGRVGSLLEVGTGFHPELTGRENIYLNGAILGMKRFEIEHKFDEIVSFAGVDKFIDTQVKHYSSGMYLRLAFAVAAHLDPEILLVDEVLAVGDAEFQKKCLGKMHDVAGAGRTVLLVSHNMGAIKQLCHKAIWVDKGRIAAEGNVEEVVGLYLSATSEGLIQDSFESEFMRIDSVTVRDTQGNPKADFDPGEALTVDVSFFAKRQIKHPHFWIGVSGQYGSLFSANMLLDGKTPDFIDGMGRLRCVFRDLPLLPQSYTIQMGIRAEDGKTFLIKSVDVGFFNIKGTAASLGFAGRSADSFITTASPVLVPYEWHLPDGKIEAVKN